MMEVSIKKYQCNEVSHINEIFFSYGGPSLLCDFIAHILYITHGNVELEN